MIKKFNEFIKEGMMSRMWRELDGTETRKEEEEVHVDVNMDWVNEHHSFTDANGVFHKNGYKLKDDNDAYLKRLIKLLVKGRGNTCSLNDIDMSGLTSIGGLFRYDNSFNGDISGWDVSSVTNFSELFLKSCFTGENSNLNKWKICTDKKTNISMSGMFSGSEFKGDISDWDVSAVSTMYNMFFGCKDFNGDLSKWDLSNCYMFIGMFEDSGFTGENGDIGCWKFSTENRFFDFKRMFANTTLKIDLSKWELNSKVIDVDCNNMFDDCNIPEEYKPKFAR